MASPTPIVQSVITGAELPSDFQGYVKGIIEHFMPVVVFAAVILIIWSGVEYMISGDDAGRAKKAKERIVAVVGGLIFFVLMKYILWAMSSDRKSVV